MFEMQVDDESISYGQHSSHSRLPIRLIRGCKPLLSTSMRSTWSHHMAITHLLRGQKALKYVNRGMLPVGQQRSSSEQCRSRLYTSTDIVWCSDHWALLDSSHTWILGPRRARNKDSRPSPDVARMDEKASGSGVGRWHCTGRSVVHVRPVRMSRANTHVMSNPGPASQYTASRQTTILR